MTRLIFGIILIPLLALLVITVYETWKQRKS